MIIAVDFDNVCVEPSRFDDVVTPLRLKSGAVAGLRSLRRAGHLLVLWSTRSNRSLMYLAEFNPLVRVGAIGDASSDATRALHAARYRQMLAFVASEMAGIFHAVDDGRQGKMDADLYIDDRAMSFGGARGWSWSEIASLYGE